MLVGNHVFELHRHGLAVEKQPGGADGQSCVFGILNCTVDEVRLPSVAQVFLQRDRLFEWFGGQLGGDGADQNS